MHLSLEMSGGTCAYPLAGLPLGGIKGNPHVLLPPILFVLFNRDHIISHLTPCPVPEAHRLPQLESSLHLWSQKSLEGDEATALCLAKVLASQDRFTVSEWCSPGGYSRHSSASPRTSPQSPWLATFGVMGMQPSHLVIPGFATSGNSHLSPPLGIAAALCARGFRCGRPVSACRARRTSPVGALIS